MNDKCCLNCNARCPVHWVETELWKRDKDSCTHYTTKPETGKIKPLPKSAFIEIDASPEYILMDKVNEIIAAWNGRGA